MTFHSIRSSFIAQMIDRGRQQHTVRPLISLFVLLFAMLIIAGCGKSSTDLKTRQDTDPLTSDLRPPASDSQPSSLSPLLRLHWLGKKRLAAESNATNFVSIWNMPESLKLELQTLDKLSTAPWKLLTTQTPLSNAPITLLRPLLDDLVQEESYLEIASATNQPAELVLAIKLPPDRATIWQTNLPIILKSIYSAPSDVTNFALPTPNSYLLSANSSLTYTRSGDWTLLSVSDLRLLPSDHSLASSIRTRITVTGVPYVQEAMSYWVNGRVDVSWISHALGWNLKSNTNLPVCEFSVTGESGNVRTMAKLTFPHKAPIELEPWNIPTNLVHDPLSGFMAIRGIRPLLESFGVWNETKFGTTPDQITFWSQEGNPALRFFALPSEQSSNQMHLFSQYLLGEINPIMAVFPNTTNVPIGLFEKIPGSQRLRWRGIPYIIPNLNVAGADPNAFIVGGLFQNSITNKPAPESLTSQFKNDSNIVLYDWEMTKSTAFSWIQMSQAARFVFGKNRLSITNNLSLPWIVAVSPNLGVSGTTVRLASTNSITFTRSSTFGLTGIEMHLLAEWLESPSFPRGLFSLEPQPSKKND